MLKRLLVTAQSYGAAVSLVPIVLNDQLKRRFDLIIVGSEISSPLFEEFAASPLVTFDTNNGKEKLIKDKIIRCIKDFKPEILLTGVSEKKYGIDEIAISHCKGKVKTFTYQDYWGDLNNTQDVWSDVIFVMDDWARKLTSSRYLNTEVLVVGSTKFDFYNVLKRKKIKSDMQKISKEIDNYSVFIGQPLWHLEGYRKTVENCFSCMQQEGSRMFYLPHPEEIVEKNIVDWLVPNFFKHSKEALLLNAARVFTCFSSMVFDVLLLKRYYKRNTPYMASIFMYDDIKKYHDIHSGGQNEFPLKNIGVQEIKNLEELQSFIKYNTTAFVDLSKKYSGAVNKIISLLQ